MFPLATPISIVCLCLALAPLPGYAQSAPAASDADRAAFEARQDIRRALVAENPELALRLLAPWLTSHAKEPGFHALHAEAFFAMERFEDAVAAFERAIALSPDYRGKVFHYGRALQSLGRHSDAIEAFNAMLASGEKHLQVRGHFGIGLSKQALGEDDAAESAYRSALELDPGFHRAIYRLALIQIAAGEDAKAEIALARVIEVDPLHHGAAYNRALALGRLDRVDESEAAWTRYREILEGKQRISTLRARLKEGVQFEALLELGEIHGRLGLPAKSAEWFGHAARIHPLDPRPALGTVAALRALDRGEEAERLCTMLLTRDPPMEELRAPLVELLEARGAVEEAEKWRPKEKTPQ